MSENTQTKAGDLLRKIGEAEGDPGEMWLQDPKAIADMLIKEYKTKDASISQVNSYMSSKGLDDHDKARLQEVISMLNAYFDVTPPMKTESLGQPNPKDKTEPVLEHWSQHYEENKDYPNRR